MAIERIRWTCPICNRRYEIPATAPTPARCPQCRQAKESPARVAAPAPVPTTVPVSVPVSLRAVSDDIEESPPEDEDEMSAPALSALAAIQLEVAEEAARGPSLPPPAVRQVDTAVNTLNAISLVYTVLAALAAVGGLGGLLFGLRAAFVMEASPARTVAIFESIGAFAGGLILGLTFFAFGEMIRVMLAIEENTRTR